MATYPLNVIVTVDFSTGPNFGYPFTLDDPIYGVLNTSQLGLTSATAQIVNVSNQVTSINISGGYDLLQDQFQTGNCTFRLIDQNGDWNPTNTASPYYPNISPMRKVRVAAQDKVTLNTYYLFSGYIINYDYHYPTNQSIGYVDITCQDGFRLFNLAAITGVSGGTAGQTTADRMASILSTVGFPTSMQTMTTTSGSTCQVDPGSARTSLQALKNVEFVEQGAFYMSGEGNAVFKSRNDLYKTSGALPIYYFSNDGVGIAFKNVKYALDDKLVINQANITGIGQATSTAVDSTSVAKYFYHTVTQGNLVAASAVDTQNIANIYVATRKDTVMRIDELTLDLTTPNYSVGIAAALAIDYYSTIRIKNVNVIVPGQTIDRTLQVLGMAFYITPNIFNVTFTTSEPTIDGFILDSALYGLLDTSTLAW